MAALSRYNDKRNFDLTPEPRGRILRGVGKARRFVIQRHDATRLHYDFRLELDGVYKSWAVTKVPSLDPATKRLAVEVEDHPIDYGTFEGTIPQGQYGGGTVQLWDRGTWKPQSQTPDEDLAKGHLKIVLDGERLQGGWALIRLRDKEERGRRKPRHNWLLIKEKDDVAKPGKPDTLLREDTSVKSGRTLEEIAAKSKPVWHSNKAAATTKRTARPKKRATRSKRSAKKAEKEDSAGGPAMMPGFIAPQLCKIVDVPPDGTRWVHEVKFDGYRIQAQVKDGKAVLYTRKGLDWTERFPEIAQQASMLPDSIVDGEIVALDGEGVSDFAGLQAALSDRKTGALIFFLFDLLFWQGRDLRAEPLTTRKAMLQKILAHKAKRAPSLRYVDHLQSSGDAMLHAACRMHLEGIVSKQLDAPYRSGRSGSWTKAKCRGGQEVVIGGWTSEGARFRSLLVGVHQDGKFIYSGRVGTGFNARNAGDLPERLKKLEQPRSPFTGGIAVPRQGNVHWAKPVLVAEVEFATVTTDGIFRQASFKGLREDKPASSVAPEAQPAAEREMPARKTVSSKHGKDAVAGVEISHPDKLLWPKAKNAAVTKRDLALYYEAAASRILPHIAGRPLSIVRAPDGIDGQRFFQRHIMKGMRGLVPMKVRGEKEPYFSVDTVEGLVSLAQAGVLEFHPWGSKKGDPETPARLVFDIDPAEGLPFARVADAAKDLKARLEDCSFDVFLKTTGGKGLHVVVAIKGTASKPVTWPEAKEFARAICVSLERDAPERYTTNMSKKVRVGKIFLDYLRNDRTATAVGPWSPRARPGATVAMPLVWRELTAKLDPSKFTIHSAKKDLKRANPWTDLDKSAIALETAQKKLGKL